MTTTYTKINRIVTTGTVTSYSETNQDATRNLPRLNTNDIVCGETFTPDNNCFVTNSKFYIKNLGNATGNVYSKLYLCTSGNSSVPVGSAIAVSDAINVATISSSYALVTFTFSGSNQVNIYKGNTYGIAVFYNSGSLSHGVDVGVDNSLATYPGNAFTSADESTWTGTGTFDTCFYISGYITNYTKLSPPGNARYGYGLYGTAKYGDNTSYTALTKASGTSYTNIAKAT